MKCDFFFFFYLFSKEYYSHSFFFFALLKYSERFSLLLLPGKSYGNFKPKLKNFGACPILSAT